MFMMMRSRRHVFIGLRCCHCRSKIRGPANFCVPEDFPNDPRHGGLPLCDTCGGGSEPTLNAICQKLDRERAKRRESALVACVYAAMVGVVSTGVGIYGVRGLVVAPAVGFSTALLVSALKSRRRLSP